VILLPLVGLITGFLLRRRVALLVTVLAALVGFTLVALLTDEISGHTDAFVWGDTIVALLAVLLGSALRGHFKARRTRVR
jgi:biotin transporter BioY